MHGSYHSIPTRICELTLQQQEASQASHYYLVTRMESLVPEDESIVIRVLTKDEDVIWPLVCLEPFQLVDLVSAQDSLGKSNGRGCLCTRGQSSFQETYYSFCSAGGSI